MKHEPNITPGSLITCETMAAIVVHIRNLTETGPHYGGGADTHALCGAPVKWDMKIPVSAATCKGCLRILKGCLRILKEHQER